ncbi:MAG TPA: BadF/BadG/BcrA/BcrD ATPase family protein [Beijerinckiaceae bacterium]|jgi:glucosamine kinase
MKPKGATFVPALVEHDPMPDGSRDATMIQGPLLFGFDGGGTGSRGRLATRDGRVLGEGAAGPANLRFGVAESFSALHAVLGRCLAAAGLPSAQALPIAGALGFAGASEPALRAEAEKQPYPFAVCVVTSDAEIACLGAHGGEDGGVVVAGTGTIAYALVQGRVLRFGGWGFPVSDEGSGAWIGLEALRQSLRAHDGLVAREALHEAVLARFQGDPRAAVAWMMDAKPRDYATLAPLVVERATAGDQAADVLMTEAADHVAALVRRLVMEGTNRVALLGGLAPLLAPRLPSDLRFVLTPARGDAVDGALIRARSLADASAKAPRFAQAP